VEKKMKGIEEPISSSHKQSRRHFLKIAGATVALGAGLGAIPLLGNMQSAQAADWVISSGFPSSGSYLSPVQKVTSAYNAIGSYWEMNSGDGHKLQFYLRTSKDGAKFSDWVDASSDNEEGKSGAKITRYFGQLQTLSGPYVQFRLEIPAGLSVKLVGLTFIDTATNSNAGLAVVGTLPLAQTGSGGPAQPTIISRAGWGANENYRYSGGSLAWPFEYRAVKAFIIHHSETTNTYSADPSSEVRSIYYYHAITKGWGDIGYNYLVDWKGNIYEGRAGGDGVVAGHAYQYNYGSIGVCMLGSFKTVAPTKAQIDSLVKLLAWKAYAKGIDAQARIYFVDRNNVATISGHRDVLDTTCPGDAGYAILPSVRQQVASQVSSGGGTATGTYNVALKSLTFSPTTVKVGDLLKVEAVITNTGTLALQTQDPAPGYIYEQGQAWDTQNFAKVSDRFRLAVDFAGNTGTSHPYRWGLGKTVQPGETVTVTGFIRMKTAGQVSLFGGVIREYYNYVVDNVSTTQVQVSVAGPKPTDAASPKNTAGTVYFPETKHNLGGSFYQYWKANGGLAVFGYPITEEFQEASATEAGKTYTVQYFQRNRFEYHPENKGTKYEVLLGLLGVQLTNGRNFPKVGPIPNTSTKIYFPETGHTLGGTFYQYWKSNGGLALFGYPISEEFQERNADDGKTYTVQYFERNRFEYHPENKGTNYEVLLGLLGTQLCRQKGWM
jgi:hypothetical protein